MRLIKRGPWEQHVACPHCKSTVAVEHGDVLFHRTRDILGTAGSDLHDEWYAVCMICKKTISIPHQQLPEDIRERAAAARGWRHDAIS